MDSQIIFAEKQQFRQIWWLWIILLPVNGLFIFGFIRQAIFGIQFGDKPASDTGLAIAAIIALLVSALIFSLTLETNIKTDGIYVRFYPIQVKFKYFSWENLKASFVRKYNPLGEYGGWGIRGLGKNRAFNVSGNKGIQLITHDNARFLIGTKKPEEAELALRKIGKLIGS